MLNTTEVYFFLDFFFLYEFWQLAQYTEIYLPQCSSAFATLSWLVVTKRHLLAVAYAMKKLPREKV